MKYQITRKNMIINNIMVCIQTKYNADWNICVQYLLKERRIQVDQNTRQEKWIKERGYIND